MSASAKNPPQKQNAQPSAEGAAPSRSSSQRSSGERRAKKQKQGQRADSGRRHTAKNSGRDGQRRRRKDDSQRPVSVDERARRALHELRLLAHALADRHGEDLPVEQLDELAMPIRIPLQVGRDKSAPAAKDLVRELDLRVEAALKDLISFRQGRVYCFQCTSSDCKHATPEEPTQTFAGYTPTGKPSWTTFLNLMLAREDERVDQLYGEKPKVLAIMQTSSDLTSDLLPSFGRHSLMFNVLGQVVVGLVPCNLANPQDCERIALTVQVLETRSGARKQRLRMNLIGLTRDQIASAAGDGNPRGVAERLRRTLGAARSELSRLAHHATPSPKQRRPQRQRGRQAQQRRPNVLQDKVETLLRRLRGDLEKVFSPHRHRTHHAHDRHLGGERPTSNAFRDAANAPDERLYLDKRRGTIIVLGPRSRAHVFSPNDGRHITSLQLQSGELDRKITRGRWRVLTHEQCDNFRLLLAAKTDKGVL